MDENHEANATATGDTKITQATRSGKKPHRKRTKELLAGESLDLIFEKYEERLDKLAEKQAIAIGQIMNGLFSDILDELLGEPRNL